MSQLSRGLWPVACGLALLGCLESPFAPSPAIDETPPATFSCDLDCPGQIVSSTTACTMTLEGKLDERRETCSFPDGTEVRFSEPLALDAEEIEWSRLALSILRGGSSCLEARFEPLRRSTLVGTWRVELSVGSTTYSHSAKYESRGAGSDARPVEIEVRCGGQLYRGEGLTLCDSCVDRRCESLPLISLQVFDQQSALEFWLQAGETVSPLFTCR